MSRKDIRQSKRMEQGKSRNELGSGVLLKKGEIHVYDTKKRLIKRANKGKRAKSFCHVPGVQYYVLTVLRPDERMLVRGSQAWRNT